MDNKDIDREAIRKTIYSKISDTLSMSSLDKDSERVYYDLVDRFVDNFAVNVKKDKFSIEKIDLTSEEYYDLSCKKYINLAKSKLFLIKNDEKSCTIPVLGDEASIFEISDYVTLSFVSSLVNFSDIENPYKKYFLESLLWGVLTHFSSDVFNELEIESILTDYYISYPVEIFFSSQMQGDIDYLQDLLNLLDIPLDDVLKYGDNQYKFFILAYCWSLNEDIRNIGVELDM